MVQTRRGICLKADAHGAVLLAENAKISRRNCELARKLGLNVLNIEFSVVVISGDSANAILCHHSFEHITTPNEYLRKVHAVLKVGGDFRCSCQASIATGISGNLGTGLGRILGVM